MAVRRCDKCRRVIISMLPVVPGATYTYTCYQCLDKRQPYQHGPRTGGLLPSIRAPRPEKLDGWGSLEVQGMPSTDGLREVRAEPQPLCHG